MLGEFSRESGVYPCSGFTFHTHHIGQNVFTWDSLFNPVLENVGEYMTVCKDFILGHTIMLGNARI